MMISKMFNFMHVIFGVLQHTTRWTHFLLKPLKLTWRLSLKKWDQCLECHCWHIKQTWPRY